MSSMIVEDPVSVSSSSDASSKAVQFLQGIKMNPPPPGKPCLSPIRQRPKSSLSPQLKASMSTGSLKRNKISFGEVKTLVFEKEIAGHDEDHKNSVWYSKQEMKSIRKDLKKSIKKGEISRGLEQYQGDFGEENKQKRLNHIYSILDLQREQQEKGIQDDRGFQMLSRAMSADDIGRARRLASMDSREAFQEYQKTNNHIIRTSSRNALDNFRKTIHSGDSSQSTSSSNGRFGFGARAAGTATGTAGKNATFGMPKKKDSGSNLLLQFMASKQKQKAASGAQAGVA
jgi:hypothetical protein